MRTIKVRGGFFYRYLENIFQLCMRGGRGWWEGGRGDLKMGMGKEEVGEDVREGRRVNSPHFQQLDRCSTLSSTFPPSAA